MAEAAGAGMDEDVCGRALSTMGADGHRERRHVAAEEDVAAGRDVDQRFGLVGSLGERCQRAGLGEQPAAGDCQIVPGMENDIGARRRMGDGMRRLGQRQGLIAGDRDIAGDGVEGGQGLGRDDPLAAGPKMLLHRRRPSATWP